MAENKASLERLDEKVDQLSGRVGRFESQVEARFDRVESSLSQLLGDFGNLQRTLVQVAWALSAGLLGLLVALVGIIATQL